MPAPARFLAPLAALALASCAPSYFESASRRCLAGTSSACVDAYGSAPPEVREEYRGRALAGLTADCERGVGEACATLGRAHVDPPTSFDGRRIGLVPTPDPALGVALLSRACPGAGLLPDAVPVDGAASRALNADACDALLLAALHGRGTPRDWSAGLRIARLSAAASSRDRCREGERCSSEERAVEIFETILHAQSDEALVPLQAALEAEARAALDAGQTDDAARAFLMLMAARRPIHFADDSEVFSFPLTDTLEALAVALWPHIVDAEIARGRLLSAAWRARLIVGRLRGPESLRSRGEVSLAAAWRATPAAPAGSYRADFFALIVREIFADRSTQRVPIPGGSGTQRGVRRWRLTVSDPSCAWLAERVERNSRHVPGPVVNARLDDARCAESERAWEESGPYLWHRMVSPGSPARTEYRTATDRTMVSSSGCGRSGGEACYHSYTATVPVREIPAVPPTYVDEHVTRVVWHRELRFRVEGRVVVADRPPAPLSIAEHFVEDAYDIPEQRNFSVTSLESLRGNAETMLYIRLREIAGEAPPEALAAPVDTRVLREAALRARQQGDAAAEAEALLELATHEDSPEFDALYAPLFERHGVHPWDVRRMARGYPLLTTSAYLWYADLAGQAGPAAASG